MPHVLDITCRFSVTRDGLYSQDRLLRKNPCQIISMILSKPFANYMIDSCEVSAQLTFSWKRLDHWRVAAMDTLNKGTAEINVFLRIQMPAKQYKNCWQASAKSLHDILIELLMLHVMS
uniref:AlNc14C82G5333 protein n=1 Tax=Albugo laibachii Nc14 TaxID=890382 RepID=F0WFE4_9STRA|nr:AlNc14C82G5333 [Albugo laibachii Nc14]|eukprot:CCA19926.1 AlNc14C82G5333 [Albugo laibachii Nc14]